MATAKGERSKDAIRVAAAQLFAAPRHPYTRGLLASLPRVGDTRARLPVLTRDPAWLSS